MTKTTFTVETKENGVLSFSNTTQTKNYLYQVENTENKISLLILPTNKITLGKVDCKLSFKFQKNDLLFCNGYQSWTACKERYPNENDNALKYFPKNLMRKYGLDCYGDYRFYKKRKGVHHGYTYAYIRRDDCFFLFGSTDEQNGYTIIEFLPDKGEIHFVKDCYGKQIDTQYQAFSICCLVGKEKEVFDSYFNKWNLPSTAVRARGYTSWYNYYQNIDEEKLQLDLKGLDALPCSADIFQIDDGYEKAVGDWLIVDNNKFPKGMANLAQKIHNKGLLAGIWFAPFVCEKNSQLFRTHSDWLLRDEKGNLAYCGCNWSGAYALDFYNENVRKYISKCLLTAVEWGYDLFKLDFLYAVAMFPQHNKTRAEIMFDAMNFLREVLGKKLILGCGVPLAAAFGKVDYCRIGADVTLDYDDKLYMRFAHSERPSTRQTMNNSIYRRQLNGRVFVNDTDVFILRNENTKLTMEQKTTLAKVNGLFGGLLFASDRFTDYGTSQLKLYEEIASLYQAKILFAGRKGKNTIVKYSYFGKEYTLEI